MVNFWHAVKSAEAEMETRKREYNYDKMLATVIKHVDEMVENNPEMTETEAIERIRDDVFNYLQKINGTNITRGIIEYYIEGRLNSTSEYNLKNAYNDVIEAEKRKEIDIMDYDSEDAYFGYELDENMRRLVIGILQGIREDLEVVADIMEPVINTQEGRDILLMSASQRKKVLRDMGNNDRAISELEKAFKFCKKGEVELLKERVHKATSNRLTILKKECIEKIVESVKILDSIGLLDDYNNMENDTYTKLYLSKYNYSGEEIRKSLTPEQLKKLSIEQLIAMTSFWINRVNKIVGELNKCAHIIKHSLYSRSVDEEGKTKIEIAKQNVYAVELKKKILRKICVRTFIEAGKIESDDPDYISKWVNSELEHFTDRYGEAYKKMFDELLPDAENNLENDMVEGFPYENTVYNSYRIKDSIIQAILIGLLNGQLGKTENYGYIKEDDIDISQKTFILIGIDVPGMNMPLRLHVNRKMLMDVVSEVNDGSTMFPVYRGHKDFKFSDDVFIPTYIYVPVPKEKHQILEQESKRDKVSEKSKRTRQHLYYIARGGKLPEHMRGKEVKYVDLAGEGEQLIKE